MLITSYNAAIARGDITEDVGQREVITHFQRVADSLETSRHAWFSWRRKRSITGLYLYGPVGIGKTYLMDLFYQQAAAEHKARFHFHHFMQMIDAQLRQLQGHPDPLKQIAADLAKSTRLLCLDEVLVHDVADAMILATLFEALFAEGIVLIATSNTKPDDLYLNGVQRIRFLPAIALIKQHCEVLALPNHHDYRVGRMPGRTYLYPLNGTTHEVLMEQFNRMAQGEVTDGGELTIQNRPISFIKCSSQVVWFDFNAICNIPRSQLDYLEIASRFETVFISNLPVLNADDNNTYVVLFMHFIDVMYDQKIRVVISAAVSADQLYLGGGFQGSFQRTLSRLLEMQSVDYF